MQLTPSPIEVTESQRLAGEIRAVPRHCWWNAYAAWLHAPDDTRYVEGYVVSPIAPIAFEHGWLERADGVVLDPTLCDPSDDQTGRRQYFAGVRYTLAEAEEAARTGRGFEPERGWVSVLLTLPRSMRRRVLAGDLPQWAEAAPYLEDVPVQPVLPIVFAHGWGGLQHPGMAAAHEAAQRAALGPAWDAFQASRIRRHASA